MLVNFRFGQVASWKRVAILMDNDPGKQAVSVERGI